MPRRVDHEQRRGQITDALLRIASTRGLRAVTMREVAAEAGVSLRLVQYYFTDKQSLMTAGLARLAGRMDERMKARFAARGTGLDERTVFEVVLTSILPMDDAGRADQLAWAAYYAALLTEPGFTVAGPHFPNPLEDFLVTRLVAAREAGTVPPGSDPRTEVATLLALANGLTASVLRGQRDAEDARRILDAQLDRVFGRR